MNYPRVRSISPKNIAAYQNALNFSRSFAEILGMKRKTAISAEQFRRLSAEVEIFEFRDYRAYISKVYEKLAVFDLTMEQYAKLLGISSGDYLRHVLKGRRNLSAKCVKDICLKLGLVGSAKKYFLHLASLDSSKDSKSKIDAFEGLVEIGNSKFIDATDHKFAAFYSSWLNIVLREMIGLGSTGRNPEAIASSLSVAVLPSHVRKCLGLLEELHLASWNSKSGTYEPVFKDIDHARGINSLTYINCHKEMIELSSKALLEVPEHERDINATTVRVDQATFKSIIKLFRRVNKIVMAMEKKCEKPDRVVQINTQLFNLLKNRGEKND